MHSRERDFDTASQNALRACSLDQRRLSPDRTEPDDIGDTLSYSFRSSADDSDWFSGLDVGQLSFGDGPHNVIELVDLEHCELDQRLRNLAWPAPPRGLAERCLETVLRLGAVACPPAPAVHPKPPGRRHLTVVSERVERYELTQRRIEILAARCLPAPRRQPRYAAVL